jgi:hypothetical protein
MVMGRVFSRAVVGLFLAGLAASPLFAAPAPGTAPKPSAPPAAATVGDISRQVLHQSPGDAVLLVRTMLSPGGTVEIRGKHLVVRDIPAVINRLQVMLDDFDHPKVDLRIVVQMVEAGASALPKGDGSSAVPEPVLGRLRSTLRYADYRLVSQGGFEAAEGTDVRSLIGQDFPLAFRLGTLQGGQSVWLHDFKLRRLNPAGEEMGLIDTNLVLSLDRPLVIGLTADESSNRALLVILTCTRVPPTAER